MIFLDTRCRKCGNFVQIAYDPQHDILRERKCDCGCEFSFQQQALIRHYFDGLVTTFTHSPFRVTSIHLTAE